MNDKTEWGMAKIVVFLALLVGWISVNGQKKNPFFLSTPVVSELYNPEYPGDIINIDILRKYGIKEVEAWNLARYRILLAPLFKVKTVSDWDSICAQKTCRKQIQQIVLKVNRQVKYPFEKLNLLQHSYPKAFFFRTPERLNDSYDRWSEEMKQLDGVFMKAQNEELPHLYASRLAYYGNRFALENPDKMVVLHFNGRSRDPYFNTEAYFAGHWAYSPGTYPTENISEWTEWIHVENTDCFRMGYGLKKANKNDDIVIVPLDEFGHKIWEKAEQTTLLEIGKGSIKLARGRYGTVARSFKKDSVYIAPHVCEGPWGGNQNNLLWYYNFSVTCPKDEQGRTAADVLSDELAEKLSGRGELHSFHGIEFDIAPFDVTGMIQGRKLDVDNDGIADGGIIDGINVYGAGVHQFYSELRQKLGRNKLILADGVVDNCQRASFVLNGVEAEGLSSPHKDYYFNELSRSINVLSYWKKNFVTPGFSYITQKEQDAPQDYGRYGRMRVVVAIASCLELGINSFIELPPKVGYKTSVPDEFVGGDLQQTNWLGSPVHPMLELFSENDLLNGAGMRLDAQFKECISSDKSRIHFNLKDFTVSSPAEKKQVFYLKRIHNPGLMGKDLVLRLESKSYDVMPGQHPETPRHIYVEVIGGDIQNDSPMLGRIQMGLIGVKDYNSSIFYFRELGEGEYNFKITIEGGGETSFRNISFYNHPYIFCREFENGVIIGNLSSAPFLFDMKKYFPMQKFWKMKGTKGQDVEFNDGMEICDQIEIPRINAVFLRKRL